ncbi:UPF0728 protein C10orf53 homolog [Diabrotica virgifera virgifera]|uniref:UPF0728 protein C10orf53 homolog n=1 Tax=Diabrotica virgifera virgifera TaxID=50390 RepID=A0A6P7FGN6_DIAVI|nr:UPF0728 protein C10orf53 homolog [Diabrotica virgifera virgifera]
MVAILRICYGPFDAFGVMSHRIQKIRGLLKALNEEGYVVQVYKIDLLNMLQVILFNRIIFQCDVRNLKFNMDYEDDNVCKIAVSAIKEAILRMMTKVQLSSYVMAKKEIRSKDVNNTGSKEKTKSNFSFRKMCEINNQDLLDIKKDSI